jgi:hypothetical protein
MLVAEDINKGAAYFKAPCSQLFREVNGTEEKHLAIIAKMIQVGLRLLTA